MDEAEIEKPSEVADGVDRSPVRARALSYSVSGLFVLAVCYTLYFARDFIMPVAAAVILALLLQPAVRLLRRARVPESVAAGVVVVALCAALTAGIFFLSDPAATWIAQIPEVIDEMQEKIKEPIQDIKDAKEEVESIVEQAQTGIDTEPVPDPKKPALQKIETANTPSPQSSPETNRVSLIEVFTQTFAVLRDFGWSVVIILVLTYFLLATGTTLRENIILALPTLRDKKRALDVTRDVQRGVSAYLATVFLINLGLGAAIGLAMHAIGLPNPALWGAMAAVLNFIPYLGAVVGSVVVAIVGLVTFDAPVQALLPPAIYIAINTLEGYLITPTILSRRLTINPIAVFLAVIFWAWLWGIPGALMAVPILACLKVVCDASERLAPLSQFLGDRRARQ